MISRQLLCHIMLKQLLTICTTVVLLILTIMKFSLGKNAHVLAQNLCALFLNEISWLFLEHGK